MAFIRDNGSHKIDAYAEGDVDMDLVDDVPTTAIPGATEEMQHQAPAATAAGHVIADVVEGAAKVIEAVVGGGDDVDDHDEL